MAEKTVEEYDAHVGTILMHSFVGVTIALGHKLGLLQAMCESETPVTSCDLAKKLDLNERYTREWLSCMAAASILKIEKGQYYLPKRYQTALQHHASLAPGLFLCSDSRHKLTEYFGKDGPSGLKYEENGVFFDWFNTMRKSSLPALVQEIVTYLDEQGFKKKLVTGIKVLDLACGSGFITNKLAKEFPNSRFDGLDISSYALQAATDDMKEIGVTNVEYKQGNVMELKADKYDLVVMVDAAHDLPNPHKAFEQIYGVLKDDGLFLLVDVNSHSDPAENADNMMAGMLYAFSIHVCLMSSMSAEPHVGYGTCWGVEEIQRALEISKLKPAQKCGMKINGMHSFFFYKKK